MGIEITDEMIEAFNRGKQSGGFGTGTAGSGPGIAAVLAIVERDYFLQRKDAWLTGEAVPNRPESYR